MYVLCYHRVLLNDGKRENRPYFLRGTAVSETVFKQHLRNIRDRFECLDESRVLDVLRGQEELDRPGCWITFDDAYVDVIDTAAPLLDEAGMRASVFVSTAVLDGTALPADRWYATLTAAKRRHGTLLEAEPQQFDLDEPQSFSRFIDGPEKRRFLRSTPAQQEAVLERLALAFDADSTVPNERLYLNEYEFLDLQRLGWNIGSHTVTHPILAGLSKMQQQDELSRSKTRLEAILGHSPGAFAYPDGVWDLAIAEQVRNSGYKCAVTLEPEVAHRGGNEFTIPRLLARNEEGWIRSLATFEV